MAASPSTTRRGLTLTYRPRSFAELVGQRHVAAVLGRLIAGGRMPQQVLLTGGSGLGKTTVARIIAAALLCTTPLEDRAGGDACGQCDGCLDVTNPDRVHPDVIELDAASHGGKDEIREIAARASIAPVRGTHRIYIIDEVHALSGPGAQAALKLLEEPPAHVVFLLCTTNPEKLSSGAGGNGTVRGRCLELELLRPTDDDLIANLRRIASAEGWTVPDDVARAVIIATAPELGVRGTVMTLAKISTQLSENVASDEVAALLGLPPTSQLTALCDAIDGGSRDGLFELADEIRAQVPDTALRAAVIRHLRARLTERGATELDDWKFARATATPPGSMQTDALLLELVNPQLAVPPAVVEASAQDVLDALTPTVEKARTAWRTLNQLIETAQATPLPAVSHPPAPDGQRSGPPARDAGEPPPSRAAAGSTPDGGDPGPGEPEPDQPLPVEGPSGGFSDAPFDDGPPPPPRRTPEQTPPPPPPTDTQPEATPARPAAPATRPASPQQTPLARRLFADLHRRDPGLARAVANCHLTFAAQKLIVSAPPEVLSQLTSPQWHPVLADASRELGRRVVIQQHRSR